MRPRGCKYLLSLGSGRRAQLLSLSFSPTEHLGRSPLASLVAGLLRRSDPAGSLILGRSNDRVPLSLGRLDERGSLLFGSGDPRQNVARQLLTTLPVAHW